MSLNSAIQRLKDDLKKSDRMPVVFIGHGTPMNAIQENPYTDSWIQLGQSLPRPQAILVISAHWMTSGTTLVDISDRPRTIHDFGNFPQELFEQEYPALGDPVLAKKVAQLLAQIDAKTDDTWGLDHGAWTVLKFMYPDADVPVFQLSIDLSQDLDWHQSIGKYLSDLRDHGVLILGSGNVVHNLSQIRPDGEAYEWALEFDQAFVDAMEDRNMKKLADADQQLLKIAHPTLDHYIPSMTIAGASTSNDELYFTNEGIDLGSVSMRSFVFHQEA